MSFSRINRRSFLAAGVPALVGAAFAADKSPPQPLGIPMYQEPLAFDLNALEPYLDAATLKLHYHEYHAQHLKELKQALDSVELFVSSVTSLMPFIRSMPRPPVVRRSLLQLGASRQPQAGAGPQKLPQDVQDCIRRSGGSSNVLRCKSMSGCMGRAAGCQRWAQNKCNTYARVV